MGIGLGISIGVGRPLGGGVVTPLTILAAQTLLWARGDLVSTTGTAVDQFTDQSGNGKHYTAAGAARPVYSATGGPNSQPMLSGDGAATVMLAAGLDLPAPATTRTNIILICRANSWTVNDSITGADGATKVEFGLAQLNATPQVFQYNGAAVNGANLTLSNWLRVYATFTGSTSDSLKIGSAAPVTGASAGNSDPATGVSLFARYNLSNFAHVDIAEVIYASGTITAAQSAALDAYFTARYGAGLT